VIARRFLRAGDRLVACELHPAERTSLENLFRADTHVRVLGRDGWAAMKALLPPPERRGLVLIDPPFEARGEFERLAAALGVIRTRFATGMALAWFPLKDGSETAILDAALELGGESKWLRADFRICMARDGKMTGCGLLALNPPWTLRAQLDALLAFLAERLAQGPGAGYDLRCSRR
jgi:23S rRNA (adenine2030-N6)-methyltransferase